jgi:hypothetical protein
MANSKEQIGWGLVVLGVSDFVAALANEEGVGFIESIFGENELTGRLFWVSIAVGIYMIKVGRSEYKMKVDEIDIPEDEKVVHRQSGNGSFLTLTSNRIIFRCIELDTLRKQVRDMPSSDSITIFINDISSAKTVKNSEISKGLFSVVSSVFSRVWGVQLLLKDGAVINIPVSEPEVVAKMIQKTISSSVAA